MQTIRNFALVATAQIALLGAAQASSAELKPFKAEYEVTWRGISAGRGELALLRQSDGQWLYTSRSRARGMFRMALPGVIAQTSQFKLQDGQVRPQRFTEGENDKRPEVELNFDYALNRIRGRAEGQAVDLELTNGLQDALSVQISLMQALLLGQSPSRFQMVDKNRVKEYLYSAEGQATLSTPLGTQKVVIYRSTRAGSSRSTWFWCAPDHGFLPMKVERRNGQKIEWSMTLATLQAP